MDTERLYYADSYLTDFQALVVARRSPSVVALDRSAFYPEGGGQPADHGTLDGIAVSDVQVEDGVVWHTLAAPLVKDDAVRGLIDWPRRLDHMQQHHGQHLLSAAFERLYGLATVSFHMGATSATIDLAATALASEQVANAEDLVNQVIWADRPVSAQFVNAEELARLPLRRAPKVNGPIRVVAVPDFDYSACGGTHPRATGAVGLVRVRRSERHGELMRVEFVCGGRAFDEYRTHDTALAQLAASFHTGPDEVVAAVERLRRAEARARKQLEQASAALISYEASELATSAQAVGSTRVVRRAFVGRPIDELRMLARALTNAGCIALLGTAAAQAQLVFARPAAATLDCGALLRQTLTPFGGRGGGSSTLGQGGMPDPAQLDAALDAALAAIVGA